MTVEWNRTVTEVVWESQTAPGITWTTVVGDSGGGTEIPARRLLPNTVGTPGQIPAVNEAGTAVEYVDAPTGGSFPTYSSAIADLPTDPSTGESWVPSDAPGALFWDGTEWTGAIFNVDAGGNLGGVVSTPADGTVILSGRGRFVKVTTSGLEFGSVASIYAANIDPSADGWVANTGSMLLSSAALWRKTGSADTDWAMIGGGGGAVDSVNGQTGVVVLTASDVGTLDTGGITTVASDYAADALADANSYTDTAVAGKQTADADLTAIAALAPSDDALIQRKAGAWTSRTPAQVKADMSIGVGDVSGLDENTRDVIGTALVAGSGVAVTVDDPANTITIALDAAAARTALGQTWHQIVDTTLGSAAASMSATITGYRAIRFRFQGRSERTGSANDGLRARFNSDSGSNYSTQSGALAASLDLGLVASSVTNTDRITQTTGELTLGSSTYTIGHSITSHMNSTATTVSAASTASQMWNGSVSNAPTSFSIFTNSGSNLAAGSRLIVEGIV